MSTAVDHALLYALMTFFHVCMVIIIAGVIVTVVLMIAWAVSAMGCRKR